MANILLGWELGGGRGHLVKLRDLAERLRKDGHRTCFAVQRLDALGAAEEAGGPVAQAPLAPALLRGTARAHPGVPATHGDILARLGLDDAALVANLVREWQRLFASFAPDLVVADFAPFLLMAARGRIPAVAVGNGFSLPPAGLPCFPNLTAAAPLADEERLLAALDRGLAAAGAERVARLPAVYAADRSIVASFTELDPYREQREEPLVAPHFGPVLPPPAGTGDEVFVAVAAGPESPLWDGLAAAGLPVRAYAPLFSAEDRAKLAKRGIAMAAEPVPFAEIAARSRLLISHGGLGIVSSGLVAGLPQVVCHFDLEKALTGLAIARLGVGGHVSLPALDPERFAASLRQMAADDGFARRAREAAPGFRARCGAPFVDEVAQAVAALA